ncbi:MAG: hypothetical protein WA628_27285 [Terriglobales bacterium]
MADDTYESEGTIQEVVGKFERCEYAAEQFTHARHLTVACWYLCTSPADQALVRMREGLTRFIAHHGKQGYHETLTRFWMELLGSYLREFAAGTPITTKVNRALQCYGSKEVVFSYYTRERVISETAKREWVEPDLRAIEGSSAGLPSEEFRRMVEQWLAS